MNGSRDDVGYRLRFSGAWRPLHDEIAVFPDGLNDDCLRRVGVDHLDEIGRGKKLVEWRVLRDRRGLFVEAFRKQAAQERMVDDGLLTPRGRLEVAYHQELGERVETEFDAVWVNRPARLCRDGLSHCREIFRRKPFLAFRQFRQSDAKVGAQTFLNRLIGCDVVVAGAQVECRAP